MDYLRITEATRHWFLPLLPEGEQWAMAHERQVYAIGAVRDKTACGVLVFQVVSPVVEIRFLAVAEGFRRQGVASGMLDYLCRHAWETMMPVVCTFAAADRRDPVCRFFIRQGNFSVVEEAGYDCKIPLAGLSRNTRVTALAASGGQVHPFFSLPQVEQRAFLHQLKREGVPFPQAGERHFCKPLCLCRTGRAGAVEAAVFLTEDGADLELCTVWCRPNGQRQLMDLLAKVCASMPDGPGWLRIAAVTPQSMALVDKLLPQRQVVARYYRAAWDMER